MIRALKALPSVSGQGVVGRGQRRKKIYTKLTAGRTGIPDSRFRAGGVPLDPVPLVRSHRHRRPGHHQPVPGINN
eukprot:748884-Pyramimonas_sp.AAC.1